MMAALEFVIAQSLPKNFFSRCFSTSYSSISYDLKILYYNYGFSCIYRKFQSAKWHRMHTI